MLLIKAHKGSKIDGAMKSLQFAACMKELSVSFNHTMKQVGC